MCVDIQSVVPKRKEETQKIRDARALDRKQAKAVEIAVRKGEQTPLHKVNKREFVADRTPTYPLSARITDSGIVFPGSAPTRFHITQLMRTRGLRRRLWEYLFDKLTQEKFPTRGHLIFDFKQGGAYVFGGKLARPRRLTMLRHVCTEGEAMAVFWATVFRSCSIELHSIDTDMIPLCLHAMHTHTFKDLTWIMNNYNNDICNFNELYAKIPTAVGVSIPTFVWFCIFCGTDYVFREKALRGLGHPRALDVLKVWGPKKKSPVQHYHESDKTTGTRRFLILFMAMILGRKSKRNIPIQQWRDKGGFKAMLAACRSDLPSPTVIARFMDEIAWNYSTYWFNKHVTYKLPTDPLRMLDGK